MTFESPALQALEKRNKVLLAHKFLHDQIKAARATPGQWVNLNLGNFTDEEARVFVDFLNDKIEWDDATHTEGGTMVRWHDGDEAPEPAAPTLSSIIHGVEAGQRVAMPEGAKINSVRAIVGIMPNPLRMITVQGKDGRVYVERVPEVDDPLNAPPLDANGAPIYLRADSRRVTYPFHLLKVGDSFTVPGDYVLFTSLKTRCKDENNKKDAAGVLAVTRDPKELTVTVTMHATDAAPAPAPSRKGRKRSKFPFANTMPGDQFTVGIPSTSTLRELKIAASKFGHPDKKDYHVVDHGATATVYCVLPGEPVPAASAPTPAPAPTAAPAPAPQPALREPKPTELRMVLQWLPPGYALRCPTSTKDAREALAIMVNIIGGLGTKTNADSSVTVVERTA